MGGDDCQNLLGIPGQQISDRVGSFDYEGARLCSGISITKKFTDARSLRARQKGK
jgi:hypothetical protein